MQTYATRKPSQKTTGAKQSASTPINSNYVSPEAYGDFDAQQTDLQAVMSQRMNERFGISLSGGAPGQVQAQIPTAELEAERLSGGVNAETPEAVKSVMGSRLGADFSNVRFHTGAASEGFAESMDARAYTTGSDVYFGEGGFDPGIAAHELVHTVQQGVVSSDVSTESAPEGGVQRWSPLTWWRNRQARRAQAPAAAPAAAPRRARQNLVSPFVQAAAPAQAPDQGRAQAQARVAAIFAAQTEEDRARIPPPSRNNMSAAQRAFYINLSQDQQDAEEADEAAAEQSQTTQWASATLQVLRSVLERLDALPAAPREGLSQAKEQTMAALRAFNQQLIDMLSAAEGDN
jgi:hypothetical protein